MCSSGAYVPPDAAYDNDNFTKRVIPYPFAKADVMYKKRVWQVIDLEQKFNPAILLPTARNSKQKESHQSDQDGARARAHHRLQPRGKPR